MSLTVATPLKVAATAVADATLAKGKHTPVNASAASRTMTLPTGATEGVLISVEKTDTSSNTVTITGNMRGVSASAVTLTSQNETRIFMADSTGSWWPQADHRSKASLDAAYRNNARWLDALQFDGSFDGGTKSKFGSRFISWTFSKGVNEQCVGTFMPPPDWTMVDFDIVFGNTVAAAGVTLGTGLALSAAADTVTSAAHGLKNGNTVTLSAVTGGGIANGTYYVVGATTNTFQLSATAGGAPIDITADGTATVTVTNAGTIMWALNWSQKGDGDDTTTGDLQAPTSTYSAPAVNTLSDKPLAYAMPVTAGKVVHLRAARLGSSGATNDTLYGEAAFIGLRATRREYGDPFDLSKLKIDRNGAGNVNGYHAAAGGVAAYWEEISVGYAHFVCLNTVGKTVSTVLSVHNNENAPAAAPNWPNVGDTDHAGVMTCYGDTGNNYIAMINVTNNQFQLVKQIAGVETVLANRSLAGKTVLALGTKYRIDIKADGTNVTATLYALDGTQIDTVTVADTSFPTAGSAAQYQIGVHTYSCTARFWLLTLLP